jgi:transcriptional antiterminator NusG
MHKWYVVQCISSQEKRVKKALEENRESKGMAELISEVLVPTENVAEVKRGQQRVSEKRMWPGYILVKMELTDDAWMFVKNTNGVIDFSAEKNRSHYLSMKSIRFSLRLKRRNKVLSTNTTFRAATKLKLTTACLLTLLELSKKSSMKKAA